MCCIQLSACLWRSRAGWRSVLGSFSVIGSQVSLPLLAWEVTSQEDCHTNPTISLVGYGGHKAVTTTETAGQGVECHQCFIYMRHHCFYKLDYGCKWNTQAISTDTREVSISISLERGQLCKSNWLILEKKGGRANSWQCIRQGPRDSECSTVVVALRGRAASNPTTNGFLGV